MSTIYFSLTPHMYAAHCDDAIILLDSASDKYLSFIDDAAQCFQLALNSSFSRNTDGHLTLIKHESSKKFDGEVEKLNYWINHFVTNNFITESHKEHRKFLAPLPLKPGGLSDYKWDHKPSWKPLAKTSKIQIIRACMQLAKTHRTMKHKGIEGILDAIKKTVHNCKNLRQPTEQEIAQLAAAVDAASLLYPKKTFCLAWASTFVLLALKKNWSCNLAIGVQTNPFYAHAWAQIGAKVIHDDPVIAQVLSVILKEPNI